MNKKEILESAVRVVDREMEAIEATRKLIGDGFHDAIRAIRSCRGKVVTMGIGKSGLIARKIAATFASTGTSSVFVHPVECLHGDMGVIDRKDIALILSKSGESDEIRKLMVFLKNRNIRIIAVSARPESHLGRTADILIPIEVPREACPMGMAPMASTTVQMIIGDALAAVMIKLHDFKPDDFAVFHPAGSLGKRLLLRVSDMMHADEETPLVTTGMLMREALVVMTEKAMGAILITDEKGRLLGILTDGDLRRAIQDHGDLLKIPVDDLMTQNPIAIRPDDKAMDALHLMEKRNSQINVLPVVDRDGKACGILRLHDLVLAGL